MKNDNGNYGRIEQNIGNSGNQGLNNNKVINNNSLFQRLKVINLEGRTRNNNYIIIVDK